MLYVDSIGVDDQIKDNINTSGQFYTNPNCIFNAHYLGMRKKYASICLFTNNNIFETIQFVEIMLFFILYLHKGSNNIVYVRIRRGH